MGEDDEDGVSWGTEERELEFFEEFYEEYGIPKCNL